MSFKIDIAELSTRVTKERHRIGEMQPILPFTTHSFKELKSNYYSMNGEIVRNICNVSINAKTIYNEDFEENPLVQAIKRDINYESRLDNDVDQFLNDYLFGDVYEMKITHPYLFNFLKTPDVKYKKISKFIADILVGSNTAVKEVFLNKKSDNILDQLILNNLNLDRTQEEQSEYYNVLPFMQKLYCEDILFLSNYKEYFLNTFPLITRFYIFNYCCQLMLKFDGFANADYTRATPLYYAMEWEGNVGKRRKAADSIQGFKWIKEHSKYLFVHMHTLAQLGHFSNNRIGDKYNFLNYKEIMKYLEGNESGSLDYLRSLQEWIDEYKSIFDRVTEKEKAQDILGGMKTLWDSIREGTNEGAAKKFGAYIEDLGGADFLKARGSSGTVLNLSHEMLLLLCAVCVKSERLPLNQLFTSFEARGVGLDRISKKIVVELLDSLNYIDKKSDSGDAHYVKPIL